MGLWASESSVNARTTLVLAVCLGVIFVACSRDSGETGGSMPVSVGAETEGDARSAYGDAPGADETPVEELRPDSKDEPELDPSDQTDVDQLPGRPLAAGRERITWSQAREWWAGRGELLKAEWFPGGPPREESIYGIEGSRDDDGRFLLVVYTHDDRKPGSHTEWEIVDGGGLIIRFDFVPPGSAPPFAHPIYVTKVVDVRGHPAKLWEARRSDGANVDYRLIYWETSSGHDSGAVVQYSIAASPMLYSEEQHIELIDRLVPVA